MVRNPPWGTYFKLAPMVQKPGVRRRRWRPGTQALHEIQNFMRMTNLLIPRTPFLWYVIHCCTMSNHNSVYLSNVCTFCRTCQIHCNVYFFRLIKEITCREYKRLHGRNVEAPELTEEELKKGKKTPCPLCWQRKAINALHKGAEAFMVGIMEDANLLVIHTWLVTLQSWNIQLARRIRGDPYWDVRDYI